MYDVAITAQMSDSYMKFALSLTRHRTKERATINDEVTFKDIYALAATNGAMARKSGRTPDANPSTPGKTTDVYIAEAVTDVLDVTVALS